MNRFAPVLNVVLPVLGGIIALLSLFLLILSILAPDVAGSIHLGPALLDDVRRNAANLSSSTGFNPILDPVLLIGAYVLVSLITWGQERFTIYWENRHRF